MGIISLEVSDAGILAAGGDPVHLLEIDQGSIESPGYALQQKKRLLTGREALDQARLHPRQVNTRFWSQLSTHPLTDKTSPAGNYAEMAYAHLGHVRDTLNASLPEWVLAVPAFMDEGKLGILLGIARELSIPVKGLVRNAVAAVNAGSQLIIHVDVHLHRVEVTRLMVQDRIVTDQTQVVPEDGWENLYEQMAKRLADELVTATRFDPLHDASTEQQLYNQLPNLLRQSPRDGGMPIELKTGRTAYTLSVLPQMLLSPSSALRNKVVESVQRVAGKAGDEAGEGSVQLSHRACLVPGLREALAALPGVKVEALPAGAAATGALRLLDEFAAEPESGGVPFLTARKRRPDEPPEPAGSPKPEATGDAEQERPTHVLYGSRAYPILEMPLVIGTDPSPRDTGIQLPAESKDIAGRHCTISLVDGRPTLTTLASQATRVDDRPVDGATPLSAGQCIRLGDPPRELHLIVVAPSHGA